MAVLGGLVDTWKKFERVLFFDKYIKMARTLLEVFSIYKEKNGVNVKEDYETFNWMNEIDRGYYEDVKSVLDRIAGSREFLKSYTHDCYLDDNMSFNCEMGNAILSSFNYKHSGSSATILAWKYKYALNNWDNFVYSTKESYLRNIYNATQLTLDDATKYITTDATQKKMLTDLMKEIVDNKMIERQKQDKEWFDGRIGILKHHYMFPGRWFDSDGGSKLFGSPYNITADMINVMSELFPDYPSHISNVRLAYDAYLASNLCQLESINENCADIIGTYSANIRRTLYGVPNITEDQIKAISVNIPKYSQYIQKIIRTRTNWLNNV